MALLIDIGVILMTKTIELWKIADVAMFFENQIIRANEGHPDYGIDFTGTKIIMDVDYILKRYKDKQKKRSTRELNEYSYMAYPLTKARLMRSYRQEQQRRKNNPPKIIFSGTLEQLFRSK